MLSKESLAALYEISLAAFLRQGKHLVILVICVSDYRYGDEDSSDYPLRFLGALAFFCILLIIGMSYLAVKLVRRKRAAKMQMSMSPELAVGRRLSQSVCVFCLFPFNTFLCSFLHV